MLVPDWLKPVKNPLEGWLCCSIYQKHPGFVIVPVYTDTLSWIIDREDTRPSQRRWGVVDIKVDVLRVREHPFREFSGRACDWIALVAYGELTAWVETDSLSEI